MNDNAGEGSGKGSGEGSGKGSGDSVNMPEGTSKAEAEVLEALQVPTQRIIAIGLVLWVVALLVTLVVPALHTGSRDWWPWACVAGFVLGSIGFLYVRRGRGNAHDAG